MCFLIVESLCLKWIERVRDCDPSLVFPFLVQCLVQATMTWDSLKTRREIQMLDAFYEQQDAITARLKDEEAALVEVCASVYFCVCLRDECV